MNAVPKAKLAIEIFEVLEKKHLEVLKLDECGEVLTDAQIRFLVYFHFTLRHVADAEQLDYQGRMQLYAILEAYEMSAILLRRYLAGDPLAVEHLHANIAELDGAHMRTARRQANRKKVAKRPKSVAQELEAIATELEASVDATNKFLRELDCREEATPQAVAAGIQDCLFPFSQSKMMAFAFAVAKLYIPEGTCRAEFHRLREAVKDELR